MKVSIKNIVKLLIIPLLSASLLGNDIRQNTEETIHQVFPGETELQLVTFIMPRELKVNIEEKVKQKFFEDQLYIWKVLKDSEVIGFAILDNVYGKSMPITFLVIFNSDLKIISSSVIKYREPYGGAVKNEKWNSQFLGKNGNSGFKIGEDISGISGATISVNSVSKGIRKLAILLPKIKEKL